MLFFSTGFKVRNLHHSGIKFSHSDNIVAYPEYILSKSPHIAFGWIFFVAVCMTCGVDVQSENKTVIVLCVS